MTVRIPIDLYNDLAKKLIKFERQHQFKVTMSDLITTTLRLGLNPPDYEDTNLTKREVKEPSMIPALIGSYVRAWQLRYKTKARPDIGGKQAGILKRLSKNYTAEQLDILLQTYCQMHDPWFEKQTHSLVCFEQYLSKVALALDKGRLNPTEKNWKDIVDEIEGKNDKRSLQLTSRKT